MIESTAPSSVPSASPEEAPRYRSGAVARMVRMPVATLRVWERRYGVVSPALSPSGQRLYTAAEVRRIALLKQLVDLGHAIGRLAGLDMAALQDVAATHAHAVASAGALPVGAPLSPAPSSSSASPAWRVAVAGRALAARLARGPRLRLAAGRTLEAVCVHDDLDGVAGDALASRADAWLADLPVLPESPPAAWAAFARVRRVGVLYGFAPEATVERWAAAGMVPLRAPQPDAALVPWLRGLQAGGEAGASAVRGPSPFLPPDEVPPRRWDDAVLADVAGLSTTVACECPRHVATLLVQLSHFEAYSAECASRGPSDAELHAYLGRVAATSRALFEAALERLALHDGLPLPR